MENEEKIGKIRVRVYLNPPDFSAICQDAKDAGFRHGGLEERVKNVQGPQGKEHWNTDGLSKFLKHTWHYWREHRAEREEQERIQDAEEKELRAKLEAIEKKKKKGLAPL